MATKKTSKNKAPLANASGILLAQASFSARFGAKSAEAENSSHSPTKLSARRFSAKADKKTDEIKLLTDICKELFDLMGLKAKQTVSEDTKNDALIINIESSDEVGLIIGNRGNTLNSIQSVIGLIYRQRTGDWKRVLVNVSDWREKEEERLSQLALHTASRAKETGEAQYLYNLSPSQRRIVHMALTEDKDVQTESQGEGKERFLVVNPKK